MNSATSVLLMLALMHGLVDAFATSIQPLWPDLERSLSLRGGLIDGAYILWNFATSVSQLVFGCLGDRAAVRWLFWAGPALAVLCMSALGLADSFGSLCVLLLAGGLGVAAFHPEAAAMAGSCDPGRRSRAMSLFAVGGYLGQAAGPLYSGMITARFGPRALMWGLAWGLGALALLALGLRKTPAVAPAAGAIKGAPLRELLRGKSAPVALVLAIGTLRVLPAMGTPLALAFAMKARGASNDEVGAAQAIFFAGIGLGNLGCALFIRRESERTALWALPLVVAAALGAMPLAGPSALLALLAAAGLFLGMGMPLLVGYGQQLLPGGQRIASSLTMGVIWGLAGPIVAATAASCGAFGRPGLAIPIYAAGVVLSSVLCAWLPIPDPEPDSGPEPSPALPFGVAGEAGR